MSKDDDSIFVAVGVLVIVGVIAFLVWGIPAIDRRQCEVDSVRMGLPSRYVHGSCYIEIADGLWVRDCEVVYNLRYVDVERVKPWAGTPR